MIKIELTMQHGFWRYRVCDAETDLGYSGEFVSPERALTAALDVLQDKFNNGDPPGVAIGNAQWFGPDEWQPERAP